MVEAGIGWNKLCELKDFEDIKDGDEMAFFTTNYGNDKLFPGGPSPCFFKGKEVPAFVTSSEGGGINCSILKEIFERLDKLEIYGKDRRNGLTPFVLLDGHGSRFELEFLTYITHEDHKWNVCIGVSYGTAIWQVADSSEQNGWFNINMNERKKERSFYLITG